MDKKITVEQLYAAANDYITFSCKPSEEEGYRHVREGFVFDENKSVLWNREEVKRKNDEYAAEVERLNNKKNRLYKYFTDEFFQYVKQECKCTDAYAGKVCLSLENLARKLTDDGEYWMHTICEEDCLSMLELIRDKK